MKSNTTNNDISTKEVRELFNKLRSSLSREETKEIRKNFAKKDPIYNSLKEKEKESSLTNMEKRVLKKVSQHLKKLKKDIEKLWKYQYMV